MKQTLLLAALATLLAACAGNAPREDTQPRGSETLRRIQQSLALPEAEPATVPPAVSSALLPPLQLDALADPPGDEREPRFDLSVDNVPARAFFMGLVRDSPHNMVVHPSVSGTISLDLKDVTVGGAMRLVREVYGYEYERTENGYVVLPARLRSQIFNVNYVNLRRSGSSATRVNSGQISDVRESAGIDGEQSNTRSVGSQIITETQADFWSQIQGSIESLIGATEGRSVVVSPQAGLVVVRAMPGELREVARFLDAAQESLHKQVILEAKVVEVQLSDAFQSGINWAALGTNSSGAVGVAQLAISNGTAVALDGNLDFDNNALNNPDNSGTFQRAGLFAFGAGSDEFAALLTLLSTQGEAQVLSSPRVATINNQKAVIKVGTDEFFVTEVESTTTTGTATTTSPSITLTPFFSGIALDVTPHVTADNAVILHIHPTVSEVEDQTKNITVAGQTQTLPLAFSSVRESDSIVRATNGQVVVIGGLMQDRNRNERGKTPFLGDLPLIGKLFQQDRDVSARSELVILLRPVVVDDDRVWRTAVGEVSRRINGLGASAAD